MARLIGLASRDELFKHFDWANLYGNDPAPESAGIAEDARRAKRLIQQTLPGYKRVILLGNKVRDAFGCQDRPKNHFAPLETTPSLLVAWINHPSRINWDARSKWGHGHGPWAVAAADFLRELHDACRRD
jgi:hypothetical protein